MQGTNTKQTVAIAGGGIGGLTAALALSQQGFAVEVFEQADRFSEIGAGIQLSPNAVRVLQYVGIGEALEAAGFQAQGIEIRDGKGGRILARETLGNQAVSRWGAPYYHIHRGDLLRVLLDAARSRENISLHNDAECVGIEQTGNGATLTLAGGTTHSANLLIGADGIHSIVRRTLWGSEHPRFTGHVAWRFLVPSNQLPEGLVRPVASLWMGPGEHFVHYYVRSGDWVNCVCVEEQSHWHKESWTEPGDKIDLNDAFSGWHENIQTLIDAADPDSCFRWALYDREPMKHWGQGRITLLGDACHPTLPFLAQGAAMAIEDAAVLSQSLARCLAGGGDIPAALQHYENLRKPRTAKVQHTSRRNGRIYHLRGPAAFARNLALRRGLASPHRTTGWLYSYDANTAGAH